MSTGITEIEVITHVEGVLLVPRRHWEYPTIRLYGPALIESRLQVEASRVPLGPDSCSSAA